MLKKTIAAAMLAAFALTGVACSSSEPSANSDTPSASAPASQDSTIKQWGQALPVTVEQYDNNGQATTVSANVTVHKPEGMRAKIRVEGVSGAFSHNNVKFYGKTADGQSVEASEEPGVPDTAHQGEHIEYTIVFETAPTAIAAANGQDRLGQWQ